MDTDAFAPLLARAHTHAADYLRLPERRVVASASREELLAVLLGAPLTASGEDAATVIDLLAAQAERGTTACASPRYFGFVIGGSYPVALAADWLLSSWDQNAGIYVISPLVSVLEDVAAEWLLALFDLPREAGVGFVTGCQMANFTALAAARHGVLRSVGWDVEADGLRAQGRVLRVRRVGFRLSRSNARRPAVATERTRSVELRFVELRSIGPRFVELRSVEPRGRWREYRARENPGLRAHRTALPQAWVARFVRGHSRAPKLVLGHGKVCRLGACLG